MSAAELPVGSTPAPDEQMVAVTLHYLFAHPHDISNYRLMLDWTRTHRRMFEWFDVRVAVRDLNRYVLDGHVSRQGKSYFLTNPDVAAAAMGRFVHETAMARQLATHGDLANVPVPAGAPPDLWGWIIGYTDQKRMLSMALNAKRPVHALLVGPPACGKTLFLEALATLPGAQSRFANTASKAGIRSALFNDPPPYLLLDELDKADPDTLSILNEVLESQTVSVLQYGQNQRESLNLRVFAAANNIGRIPKEVVSKFLVIRFREYTVDEFVKVAYHYLKRLGAPDPMATLIASGLSTKSRDIRDARRAFDLCHTTEQAQWFIASLGREADV
jgi:hypothetical protein